MIKHAIWTCLSFHFSTDYTLKFINGGLLGNKTNQDGTAKIDRNTGKPLPNTISRRTYYRYKKQFSEPSQVYQDIRETVLNGYVKILIGFQEELSALHRMSAENLLAVDKPLDRQHIIDSMVTKVIPTQSAFADVLRDLVRHGDLEK